MSDPVSIPPPTQSLVTKNLKCDQRWYDAFQRDFRRNIPMFNVRDYGARADDPGDGSGTNNDAAFASAFAAAKAVRGAVYIPAASQYYGFDTTLTLTGTDDLPCIFGEGGRRSKLLYNGSGDAIHITPDPGVVPLLTAGHKLHSFGISTSGTGAYGVHVEIVTNASYAYFDWYDVVVGDTFDTRSAYLNNEAANNDGFFIGRIRQCQFSNGLKGWLVGDALEIGPLNQIGGTREIEFAGLEGARQFRFYNNSMNGSAGIWFAAVHGLRFEHNHYEIPTTTNFASTLNTAQIVIYKCREGVIQENRISALGTTVTKPLYTAVIVGDTSNQTKNFLFERNEITSGSNGHIGIDSHSSNVTIGENTYSSTPPVISDSGIGTIGVVKDISGTLVNGWSNFASSIYGPARCYKGYDGIVSVNGVLAGTTVSAGTTMATLPVGFRPNYTMDFMALTPAGVGSVTVTTAGNILTGSASTAGTYLDEIRFLASDREIIG